MNTSSNSTGIGFAGLLTIVFITLKLTGYIAWSWWWVLSPLWISFLLAALIIIGLLGFMAKQEAEDREWMRKRRD